MSAVTTTTAAPTKAESYLSALRKVTDPKSADALALLAHVGEFVASDAEVRTGQAVVEDLTGQLTSARTSLDGLVTFRNRAILAANRAGFARRAVVSAYGVSLGTVQKLADADKTRAALKAGGNTNPPSAESLVTAVTNLPKGTSVADVIKHAETTGMLPTVKTDVAAAPKPTTPKSVLTRAQGLSDAVKSMTVKTEDAATIAEIRKALTKALANLEAHAPKRAPKPSDIAPKATETIAA